MQLADAKGAPIEPRHALTYFGQASGVAAVLSAHRPARAGIVGLGAGTLAAYFDSGQALTYYEIDPLVVTIADDARWFTFLSEARRRGVKLDVVPGDARLTLAQVPRGSFDLLVVDAFSGDSVPIHLLTREALEVERATVADGGVLLMHISSRYLELAPVVARGAASIGLEAYASAEVTKGEGETASLWIVLVRSRADLKDPGARWIRVVPDGRPPWTDDYADVFSALNYHVFR
jgi:spermidine synthase